MSWPKKSYLRRNSIAGQFSARTIAMLESPAYQVLTLSARRVLDRLEIEHAHHGGRDNGELPCSYDDFESYGIHRHSIKAAIDEAVALGFVEITEHGRAGNAEWRRPHKFRLTYRHTNRADPTEEWRKIRSLDEALMLAKEARIARKRKNFPVTVSANSQCGKRTTKGEIHSAKTATTSVSAETATTSIFRTSEGRKGPEMGAEDYGMGRRQYEISTDPRAMQQYATLNYGGFKFDISPRWLAKFKAEKAVADIAARRKAYEERAYQ